MYLYVIYHCEFNNKQSALKKKKNRYDPQTCYK